MGKRKEYEINSDKYKKKQKKDKKKYDSSSSSDSKQGKYKKKYHSSSSKASKWKKYKKKYDSSSSSDSEHKKYKKECDSSSSSDSDSGKDMQWVEAPLICDSRTIKKESPDSNCSKTEESLITNPCKKQRDSWMDEESFGPTLGKKDLLHSSSHQRRLDAARELQEKEKKIQKERELNPHWENDGTGLPMKKADVESLSLPSTSVGDGGYSWLKKAYYRIQEQAQQEGRSMEEVAVERWGSLKKLTLLIEEAEERMKMHPDMKKFHSRQKEENQRSRYNRAQFKKPSDLNEYERNFDSPFKFKKPSNDSKNLEVVNQFSSSRKSSKSWYNQLDDRAKHKSSDSSNHSGKEVSLNSEKQNYRKEEKQISDSRNSIPAWKKPKNPVEIKDVMEVSKDPHPEISHSVKGASEVSRICSEEDLSKLAAKQIKAEIMGDTELAQKLKEQLEEARKIVKEKGFANPSSKKVEEVILSKIDIQGQERPLQVTQEKISAYKQKKPNKYFDDGSEYSLKEMFEREKLTTADDQMEMFVEASGQCNETAEFDYETGKISKKLSQKLAYGRQEEKDIGKAMHQHRNRMASLERCEYCLDQPRMKKHLIIDIGDTVYLCLPNYQTMADGHCLIVPKSHVSSLLLLEENELKEVNDFKNQLRNLFRSANKSVIFLETSMNFKHFPHAKLECIPVPEEDGDMAPFYFKKAIQESEAEWAHNKKLIDLTDKGLQYSVPKNLPYFHVEFDPKVHAGYAHVIEDEKRFPRNFGKEVVGGMLDIDYNHLYKNKREDSLKKSKEVVEFEKRWKKFKDVAS